MHLFNSDLTNVFLQYQNPEKAASGKAYMRNQFEFFGLTSPVRKEISKTFIRTEGLPPYSELKQIIAELYTLPQREFHYFAIELLALYKKQWQADIIKLFEKLLVTNSWWDTVDYIAPVLVGHYFKTFPKGRVTITEKWNHSTNIWLQRSSLLFQKNYKKDLDTALLSRYILHLSASKEFFIQKAIGWMLREYARTNPSWVKAFVDRHELAPLSRREALKRL